MSSSVRLYKGYPRPSLKASSPSSSGITQDISETERVLGFKPKYSTLEAFKDMLQDYRATQSIGKVFDPKDSVDWTLPEGPFSLLETLSGEPQGRVLRPVCGFLP